MTGPSKELTQLMPALQRLARILARDKDSADDLAQEALVKVLNRLDTGGEINDLRPYLMTTLRNASTRPRADNLELTEQNSPAEDSKVWGRLAYEDVRQAIDKLPSEQSELLRPLALEGVSYAELAKSFDIPLGTVMSRLSRARAKLRGELGLPKSCAVEVLLEGDTP